MQGATNEENVEPDDSVIWLFICWNRVNLGGNS